VPGLVVDRFGPVLVVQYLTLAIARQHAVIVAALRAEFGDMPIVSMDDPAITTPERFEAASRHFYLARKRASLLGFGS